jgi:hypothetical protein
MSLFRSKKEFRDVFDRLFDALSTDPEIGPRLRARRTPQRFVFNDMDLVLNVRDADDKRARKGQNLFWVWGDADRDWEPDVSMTMAADVANRYFQGKENVPLSIARGIIHLETGHLIKVLELLPIVAPFHRKWPALLKAEGRSHLVV